MARQGTPHDEYDLLEQVGTGSFGTVHRAQHKATHQVVCLFLSFFSSPSHFDGCHRHTHSHIPYRIVLMRSAMVRLPSR